MSRGGVGPLYGQGRGEHLPTCCLIYWFLRGSPFYKTATYFRGPLNMVARPPMPLHPALPLSPCRATSWLIACILAIAIRAATATKTAVDLRSKRTVASCLSLLPPCWHIPATLLLLARAWQEQDTIFKTKSMFCALLSCPKREEWRKRITALDRRTFLPSPALLHPLTLTLRLHLTVVPAPLDAPLDACLPGLLHFIDLSQPA